MSKRKTRPLSLDLPNDDVAFGVAEAIAKQRAARIGGRVEVVVTDENGEEVFTATAEITRH